MSGLSFRETKMGQRFMQGTLPRMVTSLERIAAALEGIVNNIGEGGILVDPTKKS